MTNSKRYDPYLLFILLSNIFILALYKISTYDFWTHLATGRYILKKGIIPTVNTFSYTFPDFPWRYVVGPFQLFLYLVFGVSGFNGVVIYKALLICLTFYFLVQASLKEKIPALGWFLIMYLAAIVMRERFSIRPQLWFFLFTACYLWVLSRYQITRQEKFLLWLLPLQLLWANTHGSFLIGIYLVGLFTVVTTVKSFVTRYLPGWSSLINDPELPRVWLWLTLIALIAVSLLNQHGYKVFLYPVGIGSQKVALLSVAERQAVGNERLFGPYGLLMVISIIGILRGLYRREWFLLLLLMTFLPMSFGAIRFIGVFCVIAAAVLPRLLFVGLSSNITKYLTKTTIIVIIAIMVTISTGYICLTDLTFPLGLGINQLTTPVGAADFLLENEINGPVYNDIDLGNYLTWRLFPQERVFIDGRRFSAYPKEFYEKIEFLHTGGPAWDALVAKYGFNAAVLSYLPLNIQKLFPRARWALVYWDDAAMVFLRRTKGNTTVIAENEFKHFFPTRFSDLKVQNPGLQKGFFRDLRRSRDLHPRSYRVNFALGYLYSWQGRERIGLAEDYLKKTISLCPPFAPAYAQLGLIYRKTGRYDEGIRYLKRSIRIAPEYRIAYFYLSTIYDILDDQKQAEKYMKMYNGY